MNKELTKALAGGRVQRTRWLDGCVYDVHESKDNYGTQPLSWRALPVPQTSIHKKPIAGPSSGEARSLRMLRHPHIIKHIRLLTVDATALYVISEILPETNLSQLLFTATSEGLFFREGFLWNALHQMSSACKALQGISPQFFGIRIHPDHVYVDADSNVKVDPFYVPTLQISPQLPYNSCQNHVCTVGSLLNHFISEAKQPFNSFHCTIKDLLHGVNASRVCNILPDIILHHPIVLSNLDNSNEIFVENSNISNHGNDSAFESDNSSIKIDLSLPSIKSPNSIKIEPSTSKSEAVNIEKLSIKEIHDLNLSPTLNALDLKIPGYVPRKPDRAKKWKSRWELGKEPKEVSEETLNRVWIDRLADLQKREEAIKLKETEMAKKDLFEKIRSQIKDDEVVSKRNKNDDSFECLPGITLQSVMTARNFQNIPNTERFGRDDSFINENKFINENIQTRPLPKKPYSRTYSLRTKNKKKILHSYDDMDSSLSADPGDTSLPRTSKKLSADIVPRPSMIENLAPRKVHFNSRNNPFAEYESISSTTLTFFDIEDIDPTYEIPRKVLMKTPENISEKIAKFSYFDLEKMTNEKRELMEEWRKTPPKPKSALKSNLSLLKTNDMKQPETVTVRKSRKQKYISPKMDRFPSACNVNYASSQSESSYKSTKSLPCIVRTDNKRKSISSILLNKPAEKFLTPKPPENSNAKQRVNTRASFYCIRSHFESKDSENDQKSCNKENMATPASKKRKSILGFKTPFKFRM